MKRRGELAPRVAAEAEDTSDEDEEGPDEEGTSAPRVVEPASGGESSDGEEEGGGEEEEEGEGGGGSAASDSDSGEYDSEEEERIKKELADIPFDVLERLKETGQASSQGTLARRTRETAEGQHGRRQGGTSSFQRANKNRPQEMSSKRQVSRHRDVFVDSKREVRDPRFESLCGTFDEGAFRKRFSFIYDEKLPEEAERLKTLMKKEKNPTKKTKLQAEMTRVQQKIIEEKRLRKSEAFQKQQKSKEKELVLAGKKPFYQKRSDKRKAELVQRYQELQASGQLDKFLSKRRKRNAAKDHRLIPSTRRP